MAETHELRADNFDLDAPEAREAWQSIESFPQDGRTFEVQDDNSAVYRAYWHADHIRIIDCYAPVKLMRWRSV